MRRIGGIALTAFALSWAPFGAKPAKATILIQSDTGGKIVDYLSRYRSARASNEKVVIDGSCLSACTLVLGIMPRDRVCATERATLGFHSAWEPDDNGRAVISRKWTNVVWSNLPGGIRGWITRHGGLRSEMIFLRGRELSQLVPACAA